MQDSSTSPRVEVHPHSHTAHAQHDAGAELGRAMGGLVVNMERLKESLEDTMKKMQTVDKVTLNVGGKMFASTPSTLLSHNCGYFVDLLKTYKENQELFIDHDPKYFNTILNYLRSGNLDADLSDEDKVALKSEFHFFKTEIPLTLQVDDDISAEKKLRACVDNVVVQNWYGKNVLAMQFDKSATVGDLQSLIQARTEIPVGRQLLLALDGSEAPPPYATNDMQKYVSDMVSQGLEISGKDKLLVEFGVEPNSSVLLVDRAQSNYENVAIYKTVSSDATQTPEYMSGGIMVGEITVKNVVGETVVTTPYDNNMTLAALKSLVSKMSGISRQHFSLFSIIEEPPYGTSAINETIRQLTEKHKELAQENVKLVEVLTRNNTTLLLVTDYFDRIYKLYIQCKENKELTLQDEEVNILERAFLYFHVLSDEQILHVCTIVFYSYKTTGALQTTTILQNLINLLKKLVKEVPTNPRTIMASLDALHIIISNKSAADSAVKNGFLEVAEKLLTIQYYFEKGPLVKILESFVLFDLPEKQKIPELLYKKNLVELNLFLPRNNVINPEHPDLYLWKGPYEHYLNFTKDISFDLTIIKVMGQHLTLHDGKCHPRFSVGSRLDSYWDQKFKSPTLKNEENPIWSEFDKHANFKTKFREEIVIQLTHEERLTSHFIGSISFYPDILCALQQDSDKPTITICMDLSDREFPVQKKPHSVSGKLFVTLDIKS
eukprot:Phypoly_transcript_04419.p1 GENE.Phypoly_transcript_04419~~Phypoly_transcript_04419.p1  ORF type:complete len:719 (-),score=120.79 Phypoly_transcript_04419:6-2162(-)